MVKSKTKISKQTEKKTNSNLVETIHLAKKNKEWIEIAGILSRPGRKNLELNLGEINKFAKGDEKIIFPGKILSQGEINKKIKIVALNFSEKAKEKLLSAKCEVSNILDEIKKNPEMKGLRVLKNG